MGGRFSPRDSLRQGVAAPPAPPAPWDLRLPRWAGGGRGRCGWGGEPGRAVHRLLPAGEHGPRQLRPGESLRGPATRRQATNAPPRSRAEEDAKVWPSKDFRSRK